jgi:hypothetical protein
MSLRQLRKGILLLWSEQGNITVGCRNPVGIEGDVTRQFAAPGTHANQLDKADPPPRDALALVFHPTDIGYFRKNFDR